VASCTRGSDVSDPRLMSCVTVNCVPITISSGAMRGFLEGERAMEVILLGAYYKYSSTGEL
jgi:hypothetical protein